MATMRMHLLDLGLLGLWLTQGPTASSKIHSSICMKAPLPTGCWQPMTEHNRNTTASAFLGGIGLL